MKMKRFTDEQMGYTLRQVEAGKTARRDLPGNGHQPVWTITVLFYRWRRGTGQDGRGRAAPSQATREGEQAAQATGCRPQS